jgi:hypothetical protein
MVKEALQSLNLLSSNSQTNLKEVILSLSDEVLVSLYHKLWKKSQNEFCKKFSINKGEAT